MQYVLGNMLNGAGGLNADGLSLDLQFALDKTFSKPSSLAAGETAITSRKGPSATFLRSSAATEVGPDGLIRYAPENLVIGSSAAAFSAANATRGTSTILGIDGVALTSCTSLNANGNRISSSLITIAPNQIYTLSAYMAAGTSSFGGLVADNYPTGVGAIFNLTGSGSVVSSAVVSGTVISTSIQRIGTTELYRCSITFSFTSITSAAVGFGVSNGSTYAFSVFPSASSGTVNAGAVQLERHTSARTYIPTTTAEVYAPRFDHDPITLACRGLLIEESRTNLVFPSATLTTQTRTVTAAAHTLSFYGTGTVVLSGTHSATVVGTGAYPTRTTLTFTPTDGSLTLTVTGSVTQAQLEVGSFPTSYIPTTTGSVVRSADVCSITGGDFTGMWNASEGSTFFNGISAGRASGVFGTAAFFLDIASSTTDRLSQYATSTGGIRPEIKTANIDQYTPTSPAYTNNTVARQSIGFRAGVTSSGFFNNTAFSGGINIAFTMPSVNGLYIGASSTTSNFCNGTIASLRYYRKRLPNAKLQALTA